MEQQLKTEKKNGKEKKSIRTAIYIPTRNAAKTITNVLDRIPAEVKSKVEEIIVVDNASKDGTSLLVLQYKNEKNVPHLRVMQNTQDLGYGGSQKLAYQYTIDKGFDIVVMLHGDAQYAPEYLPQLLEPVEKGEADLVFGSRMSGDPKKGKMPFWKRFGNRTLTKIENFVLKTDLSEFHSGYRVYNVEALKKVPFQRCSNNYHLDTEILVLFTIAKLRICEKTIPTHYGYGSESPSLRDLAIYSLNILKIMGSYYLHQKKIINKELFSFINSSEKK